MTEVEDSEEEEEPHLTWVNKYDRPMPQVGRWAEHKQVEDKTYSPSFFEVPFLYIVAAIFILSSGDLEVLWASRVPFVQVKYC